MSIIGRLWVLLQVILRSRLRETSIIPQRKRGQGKPHRNFLSLHLHFTDQSRLHSYAHWEQGQRNITLSYAPKDEPRTSGNSPYDSHRYSEKEWWGHGL